MKLLMTQTTLAVSFRQMGSIHQPDLHSVGERRDGEKIEEMGAGEGPKLTTRGGVNGSRSKFLPKYETSAYVPKSPQALKPRSARIAMNKLSRSRRPRSQRRSKMSRNAELTCSDRSDR